jgi:hypothetical protein
MTPEERRQMNRYRIEPPSCSVDQVTVSAQVQREGEQVRVVVVVSRPDGLAALGPHDVEAVLRASGRAFQVLEAPGRVLPEFGGSLGNSVNARFLFAAPGVPDTLDVRVQGTHCAFRIVEA